MDIDLTLRREKQEPLTHDEVDDNFTALKNALTDITQQLTQFATPLQVQQIVGNAVSDDNVRDDAAYEPIDRVISDLPPLP